MNFPIASELCTSSAQGSLPSSDKLSQEKINKTLSYINNNGSNLTPVKFIWPSQIKTLNERKLKIV